MNEESSLLDVSSNSTSSSFHHHHSGTSSNTSSSFARRRPSLLDKMKERVLKTLHFASSTNDEDENNLYLMGTMDGGGGLLPRTHSLPQDLNTGYQFSRFELEESIRKRKGAPSIREWLRRSTSNEAKEGETMSKGDKDEEKKKKAQHLESFDYDFFESRVNMQHDLEQTEEHINSLNFGRWGMTFAIGLFTALVAVFIEIFTKKLSDLRVTTLANAIALHKGQNSIFTGMAFYYYFLMSAGFVAVSSFCVAILCPVAGGSGISEIKATLNGIKIHRVIRLKTLFCKAIGVLFSVAGGLPVGKEGPMIHSGAIIGAGLSQGKSSSFGLDTSWTKFKGFRNDKEKRDFISCGSAAGVAAAFGAPIGGVLFALEEGASFWHQNLTWRTFFCAMVSAFVLNLVLTVSDPEEVTSSSSWHLGVLGTQSGTFSFGNFSGNKSYAVTDVGIFVVMGVIGGLFGALFNQINMLLTKLRMKFLSNKYVKLSEAIFIAGMMAFLSYLLSYYVGTCLERKGPFQKTLVTFFCEKPTQYNDLASLFTVSYSISIKQLLHFTDPNSFTTSSLATFFGVFYLMACWTYGIAVPSGLFVPSLLAGAAYGRLFVIFLQTIGLPTTAPDGMYALIGAAAMLGGMARMTISLTVIILECTGVIEWGLPIMVSLMAARWIGNYFNEGLYDIHIHLRHLPFLEYDPPYYSKFLRVENIVKKQVKVISHITTVGEVYDILKNSTHSGFPVVDDSTTIPTLVGIILRKHLSILLQKKDFSTDKPQPYTRKPAGETTLLYNEQYALSFRDIESTYPRFPTISEIKLDTEERKLYMDLTPYMNSTPHTILAQAPVPRAFRLFRSLGLRHLVVTNRRFEVQGIITRKDLTPSHMKECLESLSEKDKQLIQDYFRNKSVPGKRKRAMSNRFEDVEKQLLKMVDNA